MRTVCAAMEGDQLRLQPRQVHYDQTWKARLENDVGTALRISRAARRAGVERLVYTGTIASYDMSTRPNLWRTPPVRRHEPAPHSLRAPSGMRAPPVRDLGRRTRSLVIRSPSIVVGLADRCALGTRPLERG
jgi:hypothetical protein